MALSALDLANRALLRIGATMVTSFTDGTAEADVAGALYAPVRDALLSAYGWSFATMQGALVAAPEAPVADYSFSYLLPAGFLRAMSAGTGGRGRGLEYRLAGGRLHTSAGSVILTYVFRPDEVDCPPYFDAALMARLAAEFCLPLTENSSRAEALYRMAEQEYARARQIDAQQDSPGRIEDFSLINARG